MANKRDPPLISSRSPSYERARREHAHPSPPGDEAVVALLGRLVEAEHDAAAATRAAGQPDAAAEHESRAQSLGALIADRGGSAPRPEESRDILVHRTREAPGAADPGAALRAMLSELATLYADTLGDPQLGDKERSALQALAQPP